MSVPIAQMTAFEMNKQLDDVAPRLEGVRQGLEAARVTYGAMTEPGRYPTTAVLTAARTNRARPVVAAALDTLRTTATQVEATITSVQAAVPVNTSLAQKAAAMLAQVTQLRAIADAADTASPA